MGIWNKLADGFNGAFKYRPGPSTLGVGVSNLALEMPGRTVDADFYSPRYNVRRSMVIGFPTVPNTGQRLPETDLRANGLFLSGDVALQGLIDLQNKGAR
jgi:hypothetical protein